MITVRPAGQRGHANYGCLETTRLLDEIGDKDSARAMYERFLEYWKDPDQDLP